MTYAPRPKKAATLERQEPRPGAEGAEFSFGGEGTYTGCIHGDRCPLCSVDSYRRSPDAAARARAFAEETDAYNELLEGVHTRYVGLSR